MKNIIVKSMAIFCIVLACQSCVEGGIIGDMNWTDEVTEWIGTLTNYGWHGSAETLTEQNAWWLTGEPDADANGNGSVTDPTDPDYVIGWRNCGSSQQEMESFTLKFDTPLIDANGDDLKIVAYGGTSGEYSVFASIDGIDFVLLDSVGGGIPGILQDVWIDFDGLVDQVEYIKILRTATGAGSGCFFDAIGAEVPIPGDANGDGKVDGSDVTILAGNWQLGVDGTETASWEEGDFNGDDKVDGSDVTILAGNWQEGVFASATAVPEPSVFVMLFSIAGCLFCRRQLSQSRRIDARR